MYRHTNQEKLDMILIYGECRQNSRASKRLYQQRFIDRPVPFDKMFAKLSGI